MNSTSCLGSEHVVDADWRRIGIVLQSGGMQDPESEQLLQFFRDSLNCLLSAPPAHYRWFAKMLCRLSRLIRCRLGRSLEVRLDQTTEAISLFREAAKAIQTLGDDSELRGIVFNIRNRADLLEKKVSKKHVSF